MTIMFCSFTEEPLILRLYGTAQCHHPGDAAFDSYLPHFPELPGTRQIVEMKIESVQTSCGYAVPFMEFNSERTQLKKWAEKKGEGKLHEYWEKKNVTSIDGLDTGMEEVLEGMGK